MNTKGWKKLRHYAKNIRKIEKIILEARKSLRKFNNKPKYKFGVRLPRSAKEAYDIDKANGNTLWADSMKLEVDALHKYDTFIDKGKINHFEGYKKIPLRMVFDCKNDGRRRSRLVAGGHLTDPNMEDTYSSVVNLRSLRLAILYAEVNKLEIMVGDVSSAYLESYTSEKVYTIAGPEFGELEGHLLIISKALYGLRTSGYAWHKKFADTLRDMGYLPCVGDGDVWMKDMGDHYDYVCVYMLMT